MPWHLDDWEVEGVTIHGALPVVLEVEKVINATLAFGETVFANSTARINSGLLYWTLDLPNLETSITVRMRLEPHTCKDTGTGMIAPTYGAVCWLKLTGERDSQGIGHGRRFFEAVRDTGAIILREPSVIEWKGVWYSAFVVRLFEREEN
jgi:hypothetical protein